MKSYKFFILIMICLAGFLLVACTSNDIKIDWDAVNAALDDKGYQTKSVEEAEHIAGYPVPTLRELPSGYNDNPTILITKLNPLRKDSTLSVMQTWSYEDEQTSFLMYFELMEIPEPGTVGDEGSKIVEIKNTEVQKWLRDDGKVISLMWYDGKINYSLIGSITYTITEKEYLDMVRSIIK